MIINYQAIKTAFPTKAWVYAEQYDSVKIGKWDSSAFKFYESYKEEYMLLLRVFDKNRELKFSGDKFRDTDIYKDDRFISELADAQYYMYGEKDSYDGDYTILTEERGGAIYFPAVLDFPKNNKTGENIVGLKLGIKNFVRYNKIPVLSAKNVKEKKYAEGLNASGAGALEVVDYAYTGFFYSDGKEVEL